ncbi:DHBP synthase RibB-like alpha/beta domain-containing protein [Xylariaceae sp. FL0016]|nr:DHBP synthase RibB-like alpha/beta domain-containing protein [Xylariaceae sp. FL0016]
MSQDLPSQPAMKGTRILKIAGDDLGCFRDSESTAVWDVSSKDSPNIATLREAAEFLRTRDTPVAFPTETVYGLGADATRSAAVKGIYAAKGRPSDNPLIIHVSDLDMLQNILTPAGESDGVEINEASNGAHDRIPDIYKPLIKKYWPGPLTILMPNPNPSRLAPEVTAGLQSFGVRMPASPLALSLIKLVGAPLAAPSANASTKPSPTTASHVLEDLEGRIDMILDGGSCQVGVESTVVDGLCEPPVILRPGGVSIDELKSCTGWEMVQKAYKDQNEAGKVAPRAPGMKYKHYSPRARVVLYEASSMGCEHGIAREDIESHAIGVQPMSVGIIRTRFWPPCGGLRCREFTKQDTVQTGNGMNEHGDIELEVQEARLLSTSEDATAGKIMDVSIGKDTRSIAQGLFSALRELDRRGADIIFVEGTADDEDIGAAVMNRLRKAASQIRS